MITFTNEIGRFNFRVAGILIENQKVLVHRLSKDDFYAFPGGRVEMLELTENTVVREMKEELGIDIKVERLLWIGESFFSIEQVKFHELCFYYLINRTGEMTYDGDSFYVKEGDNSFEFKWIELEKLCDEEVYPVFVRKGIMQLPLTPQKVNDIKLL